MSSVVASWVVDTLLTTLALLVATLEAEDLAVVVWLAAFLSESTSW